MAALTCFACGAEHDATVAQTVCGRCGKPLRVDLELSVAGPRETIASEVESIWRYERVLPVEREKAVTLGEGWTPLVPVIDRVWVKDEATNPTGSFKDRGMSVAVSAASASGARRLVAPSAGNAAGALAAYGAEAGLPVAVAMPADTPPGFVDECQSYNAEVELVDGTISDAGRWLREHRREGDFDMSTMREPYRVEGKKTMGYELFEQFDGDLPDVVIYPTGGGTGLVGMWKAWAEMEAMGWTDRAPRMVSAQAEGCAPVVRAFETASEDIEPWTDPETSAYGLRVPAPLGGFLCLRAIHDTDGTAVAIGERESAASRKVLAGVTGIDVCPEGGVAWAAYERLVAWGWIGDWERVVVFNTGAGSKYEV